MNRAGSTLIILVLAVAMIPISSAQARIAARGCAAEADFLGAHESCSRKSDRNERTTGDGTRRAGGVVRAACAVKVDGYCQRGVACTAKNNRPGSVYIRFEPGAKFPISTCLPTPATPTDDAARPALTDALVAEAMRRLNWPTPRLTVQPPGGRTLVNLPTNLYTPDHTPRRQSTTLLTQTVTIETTPIRYTWNLGTGDPLTTTDPGAPYPDLRVTHRYDRKGTHRLSLAVTYNGRWRTSTDPAGQWRPIPGTLTLTTPTQPLQVVEATPQLRGN